MPPHLAIPARITLFVLLLFSTSDALAVNLVGNPSFEPNTAGWVTYGSGSSIAQAAGGRTGFAVLCKSTGSTSSHFGIDDSPNWITRTAGVGTRYRFTCWVRSDANKGLIKIKVKEFLGSSQKGATAYATGATLSPIWQPVTVDYVVTTANTTIDMVVEDYPVASKEAYFIDDVSIEIVDGTGPADFSPTARLTLSAGSAALAVRADASSSTDTDATPIATYRFDFGDGSPVVITPTAVTQHAYASPGTYTTTLIVEDTAGNPSAPVSATFTVSEATTPIDDPPVARLTLTKASGSGFTVNADASRSTDDDATPIDEYRFDFGDGSSVVGTSSPTASHTYSNAGTYTVKLTVIDTGGNPSSPVTGSVTFDPVVASADVAVYTGYYDTHHPGRTKPKPNPWMGASNVVFVGKADGSSGGWDSSCLRIDNLSGSSISGVNVTVDIGSKHYALWSTQTIPAGKTLILAQTKMENFDGSDTNPAGCIGCSPSKCTSLVSHTIPVVHVTIAGRKTDYYDVKQLLNTHGVDAAGCPYTGTRNDESEAWQRVFPQTVVALLSGAEPEVQAADDESDNEEESMIRPPLALAAPYPNPNRGEISIQFQLPKRQPVRLGVYDVTGRLVTACIDNVLDGGTYTEHVSLSGSPAGMYFFMLWTPDNTLKRSFVLVQ